MFVFKHPKYYTELRKRNRDLSELQRVKPERSVPQSDQAISSPDSREVVDSVRLVRATSLKLQASSSKLRKHQATSLKPQAASVKLQATSVKLHDS
jgi:hypothetical protein